MNADRAEQDNEEWHIIILEEQIGASGVRPNPIRFRLLPQLIAFAVYQQLWLLRSRPTGKQPFWGMASSATRPEDIGQSAASTRRKSSLTARSFHGGVSSAPVVCNNL